MKDDDVEKIIKRNMNLQMNLAGIRQDFEEKLQRTWVGLRDDEIYSVLENLQVMHHRPPTTDSRVIFAQAIEAKLKQKNGYAEEKNT